MLVASHTSSSPLLTNPLELPLVLHTRVVTGEGGGPEKTILNSPRFLPELGYRSICAYMRHPNDAGFDKIRQRAAMWDAPLIEVDDKGPFDLSIFQRFLAICREHKVAIWHGHDYKSNLIGLWVNRYWPMKLITTVHGWVKFTYRTPVYYAIDRFCLRQYEKVICVSDDLQRASLKAGVKPKQCHWIDNAIDTVQFSRTTTSSLAKKQLGFDEHSPLIGAVGRLSSEKGFDLAIKAVANLIQNGQDVNLVIAGEGDQRGSLEQLISDLGVGEHVRLLGYCSDTIKLFQAFDLFVLSSYREGLPNVILEAMAMGVPVIATEIAGIPRVITNGVNGMLIPPGDSAALQQALATLLVNADLRNQLAVVGRETIESHYSFSVRMSKVAAIYDSVLTAK